VRQRIAHDAGPGVALVQHPVELSLAADQGLDVLERSYIGVLGGGRPSNGDQGLAGRVRHEVEVEIIYGTVRHAKPGISLWIAGEEATLAASVQAARRPMRQELGSGVHRAR